MNKRKIFVLSIGFTIILITFIAIVIVFVYAFKSASDLDKKIVGPVVFFLYFPLVWEELSLLRSVYKFMFFSPNIPTKICYIFSALMVLAALIFQVLAFHGVITQDIMPEGYTAASSRFVELILLTEWGTLLVSFVLGSIKIGKIKEQATAN